MQYKSGLDILMQDDYQIIKDKKLGLVTNHTGLNSNYKSNIDLFYQHPDVNLAVLYGPEHGVRGKVQAGMEVENGRDNYTGLTIYSLYGNKKKPTAKILKDIDLLVYDIQDIGLRFYTYITTLLYCLESCAENDKEIIVLDRLNPLGRKIEGNIREEKYKSFIGFYPIPNRYGMTVGELASWANEFFNINAKLTVIKLEGWQGEYFDELNLQWIPPSPNIPQFKTALIYPITCLFEGTNISEGRGTPNPFEYIGAPWIDPIKLVDFLNNLELANISYRPVFFVPTFSKYQGEECGGIQVLLEDREKIASFYIGIALLKAIFDLYPEKSNFLVPRNNENKYFFDLIMGTAQIRLGLEEGKGILEVPRDWQAERNDFLFFIEDYLLY